MDYYIIIRIKVLILVEYKRRQNEKWLDRGSGRSTSAPGALNATPIYRLDRRPRHAAKGPRATRAHTEPA